MYDIFPDWHFGKSAYYALFCDSASVIQEHKICILEIHSDSKVISAAFCISNILPPLSCSRCYLLLSTLLICPSVECCDSSGGLAVVLLPIRNI